MMDRALQERVIGAIVLVVATILIVPIFLDGPSSDAETVSEAVTLPGQNDQERKTQTIVLERDRDEPVPGSAAIAEADADPPQSVPQPQAEKSEPPPKPVAQPAAAPSAAEKASKQESTTGMWAVQLGSFSSQENAERLAADLRNQGYAAFLSQLGSGTGQLHRVRIGPQKDRESAESVAGELGKAGHDGQVVPHP